ncbi:MAG TPA: hypothetical protein PK340_01430 [Bacilli bacterium]|nr:hypothetical protein [Bacilli bacterium]
MLKPFKFLTFGLGVLMTVALASCGKPDPELVALQKALDIPTIAIKNNGQSLEKIEGEREAIDGALYLLRDVVIYDIEADLEYEIELTWSFDEGSSDYWAPLKERDDMPGLVTNTPIYLAIPRRPAFGAEAVDSVLTATAHYNDKTVTKDFDLSVLPEDVDVSAVPLMDLNSMNPPEGAPDSGFGSKLVRVRGYLTKQMLDWNTVYLHNGSAGIALYRLDSTPEFIVSVDIGDFVEAMGSFSTYSGARQIGYVTRLVQVAPEEGDEMPTPRTITATDWPNLRGHSTSSTELTADDGSLIRIEGLTFDATATGTINLSTHFTLKLKLGSLVINVYLNYHVDLPNSQVRRQQIVDLITQGVDGATLTYEGTLGWFNGAQLLPIMVEDFTVVAAA